MFIATANMIDPIPEPLRDRMEIIELAGYIEVEKVHIANKYLGSEAGRRSTESKWGSRSSSRTTACARLFTAIRARRVRNLEREIATLIRKQARRIAEGKTEKLVVTPEVVHEALGVPKYRAEREVEERVKTPGVSVGLVWTPSGGDIVCSSKPAE